MRIARIRSYAVIPNRCMFTVEPWVFLKDVAELREVCLMSLLSPIGPPGDILPNAISIPLPLLILL